MQTAVWFEFEGATIEAVAVNISRLGLLVSGSELPPVGGQVGLRFSLGEAEELELQAMVRHRVHGCGVEFIEVLPGQQMKLMAYLDKFVGADAY